LHNAATEQRLFDSLAGWAGEAAARGSADVVLTHGAERFEVALTRDQFVHAVQLQHREITRLLHELRPAGAPVTLIAPALVANLPGLREELEQFVGCELVYVPDGFAASATSMLELPARASDDPVRLSRRLPPFAESDRPAVISREVLGAGRARNGAPSHVLLNGQVYAVGGGSVIIGRAPTGPRSITLPDGLAGVSRRHCTLSLEGDELILIDHSSCGSFVNGERVAERVSVRAGDRVRLGEPGVELALLAVGEAQ
jgi:hypothetical protein